MANIPAECTNCGNIFPVDSLDLPGTTTVIIENSRTRCPNCNSMANIFDGQFLVSSNVAEFISGPKATKEALEKLQGIIQQLQNKDITPRAAVEKAIEIDPEFGGVLLRILEIGVPAIGTFAAVIAVYLSISSGNEAKSFQDSMLMEGKKQTKILEQMLSEKAAKPTQKNVDITGDLKPLEIPIPKTKPGKPNQKFYRTRSEIIFWNPSEFRVRIYPGGIE